MADGTRAPDIAKLADWNGNGIKFTRNATERNIITQAIRGEIFAYTAVPTCMR